MPGRFRYTSTVVPFWPRNRFTASSVVQPFASSIVSSTFAMMSPRRMPCLYAGEPSKSDTTVMSPSTAEIVMPSP